MIDDFGYKKASEDDKKNLIGIVYGIFDHIHQFWYIGTSIRTFRKRYRTIKSWWKWSHNDLLSRNINKYGVDNFSIYILEHGISQQEELDKKEIFYIKKHNSMHPNGYNFDSGGKGGRVKSEVSKLKKCKTYTLKDRNGKIITFTNASKFCLENRINVGDFGRMINGKQIFAGNHCLLETDMRIERRSVGMIKIKDSFGGLYEVFNMEKFAKEHNLCYSSFNAMCRGKNKRCGDFSLATNIE